jgi:hypothetical protein
LVLADKFNSGILSTLYYKSVSHNQRKITAKFGVSGAVGEGMGIEI